MTAQDRTRRSRIVDFIRSYRTVHAYGPTVRDITAAVGLGSTSATVYHLRVLRSWNRITWDERVARSIRVEERVA